ncbi:MAG: glucosaminidase domain-containing protein [Muribaculaceae bacterium]|nr:glucosaminidase domain-containing protein [Muribaculaceae bacterium]
MAIILLSTACFNANAQADAYNRYIKQYKDIAIKHQKKYGIPASITLAQGLLESSAGSSRLAREANNHFGIKCGSGWKGKTIKHKAERGKECFRKYKNAEESYEDHSRFLKRDRYKPLFKLKTSDYKGWARTLRKCGYATDKKYPDKLISLIERYKLYQYDGGKLDKNRTEYKNGREVHKLGKMKYVTACAGDTYESLAKELGIKKKKLLSFNDAENDAAIDEGDRIFITKKEKKFPGKEKTCIVEGNETLHDISQRYGIQLKSLLKMNKLKDSDTIKTGDILKIR